MADPILINCDGTCAVTVTHELALPPLQLSAEEGALIAAAILAVWSVAWGFRVLIRTLNKVDGETVNLEKDD